MVCMVAHSERGFRPIGINPTLTYAGMIFVTETLFELVLWVVV